MIKEMPLAMCKIRSVVQPVSHTHKFADQLLRVDHQQQATTIVMVVYGLDKGFEFELDAGAKMRVIATE